MQLGSTLGPELVLRANVGEQGVAWAEHLADGSGIPGARSGSQRISLSVGAPRAGRSVALSGSSCRPE
jgi:hypothetical protein